MRQPASELRDYPQVGMSAITPPPVNPRNFTIIAYTCSWPTACQISIVTQEFWCYTVPTPRCQPSARRSRLPRVAFLGSNFGMGESLPLTAMDHRDPESAAASVVETRSLRRNQVDLSHGGQRNPMPTNPPVIALTAIRCHAAPCVLFHWTPFRSPFPV